MLLTAVKAKFYSSDGKNLVSDKDQDKVFINHSHLPELGIDRLDLESKRPVLTLKFNGKTIHRQFMQGSTYGVRRGEIALLGRDNRYLGIEGENDIVEVKKSNLIGQLKYFCDNPRQDVRLAVWLTVISILVSFAIDKISNLL